ncbi:MAG: hypothetical protein ACYC69_09990 [Thermodesulfovibrionales bacterium]
MSAKLYGSANDCPGVATIDCPKAKEAGVTPFEKKTEYFGSQAYLIMGNTEATKYTITATGHKDHFDNKGMREDDTTALNSIDFTFITKSIADGTLENAYLSVYRPYSISANNGKIEAGPAGKDFGEPLTVGMFYTEKTGDTFRIMPVVKNPPADSSANSG